MNDINVNLSVIDVEKKYSYSPDENVYGDNSIVSYGRDNNLPYLLKNCYLKSATLKAIIDGSVNYILGDEIELKDILTNFKEKVNRTGVTIRQFLAGLALSYQQYGGFAFQVIYSKLGTVAELYNLDFSKCRTNENGTKIFYNKKNWGKYTSKCESFDRFDRTRFDINHPTQIYYYKGDFNTSVYPVPMWYGALNDVLTEIECGRYSLNSVSNGFTSKYIFNIPNGGNLPQEQKDLIEQRIKEKFCGADTDSNFMLYFQSDDEHALSISKLEADETPELYKGIREAARANIYTACRTTPNLMGLPTETTGFNSQEYSSAFKLYQKTVIQPIQRILEETLAKVFGLDAVEIKPFVINFDNE